MRFRYVITLPAFVVLSACAPSAGVDREPRPPSEVTRQGTILMSNIEESVDDVVAAPLDEVWAALPKAYAELGIEVAHIDARQHELGNRALSIRRRLGGTRPSEYFNCGYHAITGAPWADNYEIQASITTKAVAVGEGSTRLVTTIGAFGRSTTGTSSSGDARCSTKGSLERRIVELVTETIGGAETAVR